MAAGNTKLGFLCSKQKDNLRSSCSSNIGLVMSSKKLENNIFLCMIAMGLESMFGRNEVAKPEGQGHELIAFLKRWYREYAP